MAPVHRPLAVLLLLALCMAAPHAAEAKKKHRIVGVPMRAMAPAPAPAPMMTSLAMAGSRRTLLGALPQGAAGMHRTGLCKPPPAPHAAPRARPHRADDPPGALVDASDTAPAACLQN